MQLAVLISHQYKPYGAKLSSDEEDIIYKALEIGGDQGQVTVLLHDK